MELIGLYVVACGLLVAAGTAKAVKPDDTARALLLLTPRLARKKTLRFARRTVRAGATVEAALGAAALCFPRPLTATFVAASYALFVAVVAYAKVRGGALSTCGCFGRSDTPATWLHLGINVILFAAAFAVALRPPSVASLAAFLEHQPWDGLPLLFVSGVGVWVTYLALSPLAALGAARRLVGPARAAAST